jgi:hypothetical protein
MSLPLTEREGKVGELEQMGNLELRRANNNAKSEAELAKIKGQGLPGTDGVTEATAGRKRKRVSAGRTAKPKAKRGSRKKKGRVDESEDESSAESSEEEDGGEENAPARVEPPKTRSRGAKEAGAAGPQKGAVPSTEAAAGGGAASSNAATTVVAAINNDAASKADAARGPAKKQKGPANAAVKGAKWAEDARAMLLDGGLGEIEEWKNITSLWWALEASTRFVSPVRLSVRVFGIEN